MMLPLHCQPPKNDWGLPFNKRREIPTNEKICESFTENERLKIIYSSSFMLLMLKNIILYDVMFYCKYPKKPEHKQACRDFKEFVVEIDRAHAQANPFEINKIMDNAFEPILKDCSLDISKMKMATSQELLTNGRANHSLAIAINNALLMIEGIKHHGAAIAKEVAKKVGVEPQEFELSRTLKKVRATLNKMAKIEDCVITPSSNMRLSLEILTNKFIKVLRNG